MADSWPNSAAGQVVELEPRRVVVEFEPTQYAELEARLEPFASVPEYVRAVALGLAREQGAAWRVRRLAEFAE